MSDWMARVLTGLIFLAVAMPSGAQALADPTRPPNATGTLDVASGPGASGPVLQSILLSPLRRMALIDGHMVKIGDRVGDARIVAIDFDSVKLRDGDGVTVMKLLPDAQKSKSKPATESVGTQSRSKGKSR